MVAMARQMHWTTVVLVLLPLATNSQTTGVQSEEYVAQDRDSFHTDRLPITGVAISSGSRDTGVIDLSFTGTNFQPFEGDGAVSSWRLDLPEVRKFDYKSISNVLLYIQYTAKNGGVTLRSVAWLAGRNDSKARLLSARIRPWTIRMDYHQEEIKVVRRDLELISDFINLEMMDDFDDDELMQECLPS
ncbi:hypothetical protein FQN54_006852 [Arachnomyces sp. PD_36]|nr:hypothetical protein FQN54_006852 [Arachnomyces sp. PD_36]